MRESISRPGGTSLGLDRKNIHIWWQGYAGLNLHQLKKKLLMLNQYEQSPDLMVIHCGGNDLGTVDLYNLLNNVKTQILSLKTNFPNSTLVWSQILPRKNWRYSNDCQAMERSRKKLNRVAATTVLKLNGCYLKHPDLLQDISKFLMPDGVHLNQLGNAIFLNTLQGGLEFFVLKMGQVYPDSGKKLAN
jgi:lysophospholipase L1-like esterase